MRASKVWWRRRHGLGLLAALALAGAAPCAKAQISASLSLQSDYRSRGVSLSAERPTLGLTANYDHPSGWYGGGSVTVEDTRHHGLAVLGYGEYLGYSHRTASGLSIDYGIDNQDIFYYEPQRYHRRYSEAFVGIAQNGFSAHIYYSPNYFRPGVSTIYTDVNTAFPPGKPWRVFAHAGVLSRVGSGAANSTPRYDARLGVTRVFERAEVNLAWSIASPSPPGLYSPHASTIILGVAGYF